MAKKTTRKKVAKEKPTVTKKRWSQHVTKTSDALTLDHGVFTKGSAKAIAASLKCSAERSHRRKSSPYRSAMSMLTFYINRGGRGLPASRKAKLNKAKLNKAKDELCALYGKD